MTQNIKTAARLIERDFRHLATWLMRASLGAVAQITLVVALLGTSARAQELDEEDEDLEEDLGGAPAAEDGGGISFHKDVIKLTKDNFAARVLHSDEFWMVKMYAPWCGHCTALAPEWSGAAKAMKGRMFFGAIDCTAPEGQSVCADFGVSGYPTIKTFGKNKKKPQTYQGARKQKDLLFYAEGGARKSAAPPPPLVELVRYTGTYTWLRTPSFPKRKPHLLLMGKSKGMLALTPPSWFEKLAVRLAEEDEATGALRKKVVTGFVANNKEGEKTQKRFGVVPLPKEEGGRKSPPHLPALVLCLSEPAEVFVVRSAAELGAKPPDVDALTEWVVDFIADADVEAPKLAPWPTFPGPSAAQLGLKSARKKGSYKRLTDKTAASHCFAPKARTGKGGAPGAVPMCAMLFLAADQTSLDTTARQFLADLAAKYKNDPLSVVYVVGRSEATAAVRPALGVDATDNKNVHLVVLKTGKRPRYASLELGPVATLAPAEKFLDRVLGGDAKFTRMKGALPEVTAEPLAEPLAEHVELTDEAPAATGAAEPPQTKKKKKRIEL